VDAQAVADAIATPRNTSSTTQKRLGEQRQREEASGNKDEEDCRAKKAKGRWLFLSRIDLGIDPMTEILLHQWRTTQSRYDTVTPLR
jgi:hypothetical protein